MNETFVTIGHIHLVHQCDMSIKAQMSISPKNSYLKPVLLQLACPVKPRTPVLVGDS